jgi:hypothetical protein
MPVAALVLVDRHGEPIIAGGTGGLGTLGCGVPAESADTVQA